ncbi:hypothetical protein C5167_033856 [Papaver somniferum]|uniref:Crossover junction endonuclease MUS81 n=1 Tax=Papaver somniferum TaxID=3469 RepID=A0A4Y7KED9_PAPSO|nr:hypothetical protein C5167_033856 [Papaver somniferum]
MAELGRLLIDEASRNWLCKTLGKKSKGKRLFLPQKNSVAYALLITLYERTSDGTGTQFMKKQELIDAAEASGLSRTSIICSVDCDGLGTSKNVPDASGLEFGHSNLSDEEVTWDSSSQEKSIAIDEVFKKANFILRIILVIHNGRLDELLSECRHTMGKVTRPSSIVEDMGVTRVPDYSCRVDSTPTAWTKNFSGVELEGVVKSVISYALNRQLSLEDLTKTLDEESIQVTMDDFLHAMLKRCQRNSSYDDAIIDQLRERWCSLPHPLVPIVFEPFGLWSWCLLTRRLDSAKGSVFSS